MTFEENGRYYIRGIVSVSQARNDIREAKAILCNSKQYVIFTDVAKYLNWIAEVTHGKRQVRMGQFIQRQNDLITIFRSPFPGKVFRRDIICDTFPVNDPECNAI